MEGSSYYKNQRAVTYLKLHTGNRGSQELNLGFSDSTVHSFHGITLPNLKKHGGGKGKCSRSWLTHPMGCDARTESTPTHWAGPV